MNWLRQREEPLFSDSLWSRPENKRQAGKLLVIGGHQQSFNDVSEVYSAALEAGVGSSRVILPDKLHKMLSMLFPEAEYAPSTTIGSFSRLALEKLIDEAEWADGVLLAGDFGHNSETAILIDSFIEKYQSKLTLAGDSLDYFFNQSLKLTKRKETLLIGQLNQLQKLARPSLIQQKADFIKVVEQVSAWVSQTEISVVTIHSNQVIVANAQRISSTPVDAQVDMTVLASYTSVWWLQQPEKPFEALTSAAYDLAKKKSSRVD